MDRKIKRGREKRDMEREKGERNKNREIRMSNKQRMIFQKLEREEKLDYLI